MQLLNWKEQGAYTYFLWECACGMRMIEQYNKLTERSVLSEFFRDTMPVQIHGTFKIPVTEE